MSDPLFTFIHVTDIHLSESRDVLTPFIESVHAERHHARPDFIVFGGDNINGSRKDGEVCEREMPLLKKCLDSLEVPYHIICHNHDTWGEARQATQYRHYFGNNFNYTVEMPNDFLGLCISGMYVDDNNILIKGVVDQVAWLDSKLKEFKNRKVLLFSHVPMFPPRKPVPASHRSQLRDENWEAYKYGSDPKVSKPVREVIAKHGNVIAHYTGHCHLHSVVESQKTHYITTSALVSQPWEYKYVEVYNDRMAHRSVCPHELKYSPQFWANCIDEDHPNVDLYHDGLPEEREFDIRF